MQHPLDIRGIALTLNELAESHPIGQLQKIRAELRGRRRAGRKIFSAQTIYPDWAFHHGARSNSELQFNIGTEDVSGVPELRHGVAFSFETSQTMPSIDLLAAKVPYFDAYIVREAEAYADMSMWHYDENDERSPDYHPGPVKRRLVTPGWFVFLGRRQPSDNIDYEVILNDFDRLLPLFVYVESNGKREPPEYGQIIF